MTYFIVDESVNYFLYESMISLAAHAPKTGARVSLI